MTPGIVIAEFTIHRCECGSDEFAQDGKKEITDITKAHCVACGDPALKAGIEFVEVHHWPPRLS